MIKLTYTFRCDGCGDDDATSIDHHANAGIPRASKMAPDGWVVDAKRNRVKCHACATGKVVQAEKPGKFAPKEDKADDPG